MISNTVMILGGKSDIGLAIANKFASEGYNIQLAARDSHNLENKCRELEELYKINVSSHEFNVLDVDNHHGFIKNLKILPDIVICVIGIMGNQVTNEKIHSDRIKIIRSNYEGPLNILSEFANLFEDRGFGAIIGISSVAGERGRASNYFYGSAKSGFTAFLSGLRNRLNKKNISVMTVLPGPVKTKMTKDMNLPKFLTTTPEHVSNTIFNSFKKKLDVVYVFSIWRFIMFIIKIIPEKIFKTKNL